MTCGFQLSAVKLGKLLKPLLLSRLVPQLPIHYDQHSLESVSLREKIKQCTIYNVALSESDIRERPCILTSRSHCLNVYSHSVEQNTFYLPDCHKTHTSSAAFNFSVSDSQFFVLSDDVFIGCPVFFKWEACFFCMPFMDSKTLLTTMFSILMFRIFVVQWLFVLSFFVLLMLIKRGGGKLKAIRCCCTVVVMPLSFFYHPPSGQCSGNEVQRVSQVILHSGGVYVCVYMCIYPYASPLD